MHHALTDELFQVPQTVFLVLRSNELELVLGKPLLLALQLFLDVQQDIFVAVYFLFDFSLCALGFFDVQVESLDVPLNFLHSFDNFFFENALSLLHLLQLATVARF